MRPIICHWCLQALRDGRVESGGTTVDWCTMDGDFGCDESPLTTYDGVGSHQTLDDVRLVIRAYNTVAEIILKGIVP